MVPSAACAAVAQTGGRGFERAGCTCLPLSGANRWGWICMSKVQLGVPWVFRMPYQRIFRACPLADAWPARGRPTGAPLAGALFERTPKPHVTPAAGRSRSMSGGSLAIGVVQWRA
jgi:hypothetical protein